MDVRCPKNKKKSQFICAACGQGFFEKSHLDDHLYSHLNDETIVSKILCKGFSEVSELNEYFRDYMRKNAVFCYVCNWRFLSKSECIEHYSVHEEEWQKLNPYVCKACDIVFENKESFYEHNAATHDKNSVPKRTFVCQNCKKEFLSRHLFLNHLRICGREKPSFRNSTRNKSWWCYICNEKFSTKSECTEHYSVHEAEGRKKPKETYMCKECNIVYENKESFWEHNATHNKLLFFPRCISEVVCQICKQEFASTNLLTHHISECAKKALQS